METTELTTELSTKEAAELAGVSDSYVRYLLIRGILKGRKLSGWTWLVDRTSLVEWNNRRKERA